MRFKIFIALALAAGVFSSAFAKPPKIVATTTDLASVAKAVAGPDFQVRSITNGKQDPHFLAAKPGYILDARDADLWIRIGMELEIGWEPEILRASRNAKIQPGQRGHLDASDFVRKLEVPTRRVTRSQGDVHPQGNPHFWLDPWNLRQLAMGISERLAELYPDRAQLFKSNAVGFQKEIDKHMFGDALVNEIGADALWASSLEGRLLEFVNEKGKSGRLGGWAASMSPLSGAKIVTHHKSWEYFADRFGLVIAATLEPVAGIPPTPKHLNNVKNIIQETKAVLVAVEPFYSDKAARNAVSGTSARVVVTANSVGGDPDANDIFTLLDLIVRRFTAK